MCSFPSLSFSSASLFVPWASLLQGGCAGRAVLTLVLATGWRAALCLDRVSWKTCPVEPLHCLEAFVLQRELSFLGCRSPAPASQGVPRPTAFSAALQSQVAEGEREAGRDPLQLSSPFPAVGSLVLAKSLD